MSQQEFRSIVDHLNLEGGQAAFGRELKRIDPSLERTRVSVNYYINRKRADGSGLSVPPHIAKAARRLFRDFVQQVGKVARKHDLIA